MANRPTARKVKYYRTKLTWDDEVTMYNATKTENGTARNANLAKVSNKNPLAKLQSQNAAKKTNARLAAYSRAKKGVYKRSRS